MEDVTEQKATVYYSEKDGKKKIEFVTVRGAFFRNLSAVQDPAWLEPWDKDLPGTNYKVLSFGFTDQELKDKQLLIFLAEKAQEELAKLDKKEDSKAPSSPPAAAAAKSNSGIAAATTLMDSAAAKNTYNLYALIDKCRPEINAKVNPKGYSLPDGKYELVTKEGHKIAIEANGNMAADLAQLSSKNEKDFAKFICDDLKAIVDMYKAMHDKPGIGLAAFPENKINLFVIEKNINTPEEKAKMEKIKRLVEEEMHKFLKEPQFAAVKDKFTVLGRTLSQGPAPTPAPAPKPSAPPLSEEDARKAAENSDAKLPVIIPIPGKVDVETYKQNLQAKAKGTAPEKSALIFPGNDGHAAQNNIHDVKSGGGLAQTAGELGNAGIGTLSLPATFGGTSNATKESVDTLAKNEMAKLWQAVGKGYQLVLPVREPNSKNFFTPEDRNAIQSITGAANLEPSFWGGIQSDFATNTNHLPKYYCNELKGLQAFIMAWNKPDANKKQLLDDLQNQKPDFQAAFMKGFGQNPENAPKAPPAPVPDGPDRLTMEPAPQPPPASPRPK